MKIQVYQIETTNFCNANCVYCPHPKMTREKGVMTIETFIKTLDLMVNKYTALHHFGVPFLNVHLSYFIRLANQKGIKTELSTNGSVVALVKEIMEAEPYIIRYAYDAFKDLHFLKALAEYNKSTLIYAHSVNEGSKPITNFAGAVPFAQKEKGVCYFKKYGYVVVLWDGRIVPCCCDYDAQEVLGSVWDEKEIELKQDYSLCEKCDGMQFAPYGLWEEKCLLENK